MTSPLKAALDHTYATRLIGDLDWQARVLQICTMAFGPTHIMLLEDYPGMDAPLRDDDPDPFFWVNGHLFEASPDDPLIGLTTAQSEAVI